MCVTDSISLKSVEFIMFVEVVLKVVRGTHSKGTGQLEKSNLIKKLVRKKSQQSQ